MWALLLIPMAFAQIEGRWLSEDKDGEVLVYKEGSKWYGRLVRAKLNKDTNNLDLENPDMEEHSKSLVGKVIVKDMKKDGKEWSGGTVYDPKSGKTYEGKMWRDGDNLKLRGFVGMPVFGRSSTWTPLKEGEVGVQGEVMEEKTPTP
jgi:uncharacterized protein (DUF2147 family)